MVKVIFVKNDKTYSLESREDEQGGPPDRSEDRATINLLNELLTLNTYPYRCYSEVYVEGLLKTIQDLARKVPIRKGVKNAVHKSR